MSLAVDSRVTCVALRLRALSSSPVWTGDSLSGRYRALQVENERFLFLGYIGIERTEARELTGTHTHAGTHAFTHAHAHVIKYRQRTELH